MIQQHLKHHLHQVYTNTMITKVLCAQNINVESPKAGTQYTLSSSIRFKRRRYLEKAVEEEDIAINEQSLHFLQYFQLCNWNKTSDVPTSLCTWDVFKPGDSSTQIYQGNHNTKHID